ncbi:WD40-repeat-containing domain protein [Aspergillus granulosus]|uniref:WD40-repeat-containing domain protein n=1 Tax=Aspergillus granulosus TaxID=176169 RepID=A0ABR4H253_9EURO
MDLTGGIIGVIQLAGAIATVCGSYIIKVKHAQKEIEGLNVEIKHLKDLLEQLEKLHRELGDDELIGLQGGLKECSSLLKVLSEKINPQKTQSTPRKFGLRSFKWPLQQSDVEDNIKQIRRFHSLFQEALQIAQLRTTNQLHQKIDLQQLKLDLQNLRIAAGARFDSYDNEHKNCLDGTRSELLDQVEEWAKSPQGKCIFWLKGGAGTGKSTVSQTIARRFEDKKLLAGSFFFKQTEAERSDAKRLFPTLIHQLTERVPELKPEIQKVLDDDPYISEKALGEQFNRLILQPFLDVDLGEEVTLVAVIDALDECRSDATRDDIGAILQLLPQVQTSRQLHMKFFLTSRPELPVRHGFKEVKGVDLENLDLWEIPRPLVSRDISIFLDYFFKNIRDDHEISMDWPGNAAMEVLLEKTVPLFISAATLCRFINEAPDPEERLQNLLADKSSYVSQMAATYLPILKQLLHGQGTQEIPDLLQAFRNIVGAIVMLATPLSINALSGLLGLGAGNIKRRLNRLHSVLNVPEDCSLPVRLLHLSFRDFLLDEQTRKTEDSKKFWIDKAAVHQVLTEKCLMIMNQTLKRDICEVSDVGYQRSDISPQTIEKYMPAELQYACRYWTQHLVQSQDPATALTNTYPILKAHFLHWIEAMSILGLIGEVIEATNRLQSVALDDKHTEISEFLRDARRFVLKIRQIAETAPLQLYSSALMFSPTNSINRTLSENELSIWSQLPRVEKSWNAEIQTLEGHTDFVQSLCVSPDGQQLASGSEDGTIKLWSSATGQLQQTISGHSSGVGSVCFLDDGRLVSGSSDGILKLWNTTTGELEQTFEGHNSWIRALCFSQIVQKLASSSEDGTIKLWDPTISKPIQTLEGHSGPVGFIFFAPDGQQLVSGSEDQSIKLWDLSTGKSSQILESHSGSYSSVCFSPDGQQLASGSDDGTVTLWIPTACTLRSATKAQSREVRSVVFSPDSQKLALALESTVELWNLGTRSVERISEGHVDGIECGGISSLTFSPNGNQLAFLSGNKTIKLWDLTTNDSPQTFEGHAKSISSFTFLPGGQQLASASHDKTIKLWDLTAGKDHQALEDECKALPVRAISFSPDGQQVASGLSDGTIRLWDSATGKIIRSMKAHDDAVRAIAYSTRQSLLASGSSDMTIKLWDPTTGQRLRTLNNYYSEEVYSLSFSPDNQLISAWSDGSIKIWDTIAGRVKRTINAHPVSVESVTFTPDGRLISGSSDGSSKLWDLSSPNEPSKIFKDDCPNTVRSVRVSPDGQQLASSSSPGPTKLWDLSTGKLLQTLKGHSSWTWSEGSTGISILDDQWICRKGERLLWLPQQYRANCFAVSNGRLALGHPSGRVSFISKFQEFA